jgi:hypothetical protein
MFDPAPGTRCNRSEDRQREKSAANGMVGGDDNSRGYQYLPVPVERQKGERSENVKMRFDSAAG